MLKSRIGLRIFLGSVVPLIILLVVGLAVPFFLFFRTLTLNEESTRAVNFSKETSALRGFIGESGNTFRAKDSLKRGEHLSAKQYDIADKYYRDTEPHYLAAQKLAPTTNLLNRLKDVYDQYKKWYKKHSNPKTNTRDAGYEFYAIGTDMDTLVGQANDYATEVTGNSDRYKRFTPAMTFSIVLIGLVIAVVIGRSITVGISQPIEALTQATEELELGISGLPLYLRDTSGRADELGELERGFARMARTIEQRTAMLRAQNEALGALNRRVASLMDATNDGILMLDRAGGFSVVSRRFEYFFGLERDVLLDQTWNQAGTLILSRFRNREEVRDRLQEIVDNPEEVADETFDIIEPMPRTLRIYSAPVRGAAEEQGERELLGRILVFRDVTRETMADRMKTEFVSTVSHELRTPLTAIRGYVELILGGQTGDINPVQTEFLTLVQNSTHRLTTLINDMLDVSRIESGRMEVEQESINYPLIVRDAVQMMAGEAARKNIDIVTEYDGGEENVPLVSADGDRVMQVLLNLIGNGIKYTPTGGRVTVRVESEEAFVTTCIIDTGIGIREEDIPRLFQKFFRADNSSTREQGGTGLGLAITKAILERLNGSIWVDSRPGRGSRFYFTLPTTLIDTNTSSAVAVLPDTPEQAEVATGEPVSVSGLTEGNAALIGTNGNGSNNSIGALEDARPNVSGPGLVLCVIDDVSVQRQVSRMLQRLGYTLSFAIGPEEATRRARSLRPDVILLYLTQNGTTGWDSLRAISDQEQRTGRLVPRLILLEQDSKEPGAAVAPVLLHDPITPGMPFSEDDLRTRLASGSLFATDDVVLLEELPNILNRVLIQTRVVHGLPTHNLITAGVVAGGRG